MNYANENLSDGDIIDIIMESKNIVEAIEKAYNYGYIDCKNHSLEGEKDERFVISVNKCSVSVLDTDNISEENLLVFGIDFEDNEEVANYLAYELQDIVHYLNWQNEELRKRK